MTESRVCVKYLPRECNETLLRKHFSSCGLITDCRIMKTPSGKSRQFGYVGFRDKTSRDKALKLNKSYIRTCQIGVEEAHPYKSEKLPRAWSKYSRGTSSYREREKELVKVREKRKERKLKKKEQREKKIEEKKKEEELNKFLESSNSNKAIWENDDTEVPLGVKSAESRDEDEDDDESSEEEEEEQIIPPPKLGSSRNAELSDLQWLKTKEVENTTDGDKKKNQAPTDSSSEVKPPPPLVVEEGRLFVRNLSYSARVEDIEELFSTIGDLSEVTYPVDPIQRKPKGYAFVTFCIPSNADKAVKELNRRYFHGRILHILPAYESKTKNQHVEKATRNIKSSFKKKQKKKQKTSSNSSFNWNTLYIRPDAAVAGIAKDLGLTPSSVTGTGEDNDSAVRVALAETEALHKVRKGLEEMGISVDDVFSAEREKKRSNTIILVKNLSDGTRESELRELFSKYGEVRQVKMILPSGTFAVVRFFGRNEAQKAFQSLCYHVFRGQPLYLEWAPLKKGGDDVVVKNSSGVVTLEKKDKKLEDGEDNITESKKESDANNTLYVKNISFKSTAHDLSEFFRNLTGEKPVKCRIAKDEIGLSQGYGFVSFRTTKGAIEARRKGSGKVLMGHQLVISYSRLEQEKKATMVVGNPSTYNLKKKKTDDPQNRDRTKLIVKNLAFEATKKDIYELFGTFGEIKEVRVPRKVVGGHRGFAFVEFLSEGDCRMAMDALKNTHLYGRPLVLEYAIQSESVESLRETVRSEILRKRKRNEMVHQAVVGNRGRIKFKKNVKRRRIENQKK